MKQIPAPPEQFYIPYLNKSNGFKPDKVFFDTYNEAVTWGRTNLDNFNIDMIMKKEPETGQMVKLHEVLNVQNGSEYVSKIIIEAWQASNAQIDDMVNELQYAIDQLTKAKDFINTITP